MHTVLDSFKTIFMKYLASGQSLESVQKIYSAGANPQMVQFPCIVLKPDMQDRIYTRAAKLKAAAYNREYHILIGVFSYQADPADSFAEASALANSILDVIETDSDVMALADYDVDYDGSIEYGTVEFGGDQAFCYGVLIPLVVKTQHA